MKDKSLLKESIRNFLVEHVAQNKFSGSVLVASNEEILLSESFGLSNVEMNVANSNKTKYRIGSLTKPFTALAILQLVDKGIASLENTINAYISDYPNGDEITIHHLLSHTSGIFNFSNRDDVMDWYKTSSSILETIETFKYKPLNFHPGERYEYSNSNYVILTYIIELLSNLRFDEYLHKNIFNTLNMDDTVYDHQERIIPDRAAGYYYDEDKIKNAPYINMSIPQGAGGLLSTTEDLYKFDRGLLDNLLISEQYQSKMYIPNMDNYGYGWMIQYFGGRRVIFHTGSIHGFGSFMCRFIEDKVCVIVLSNNSQDTGGIGVRISQMIFA